MALGAIAFLLLILLALLPPAQKQQTVAAASRTKTVPVSRAPAVRTERTSSDASSGTDAGTAVRKVATSFAERPAPKRQAWKLYLVIDDVGNNVFQLKPFLKFPGPLTISILPQREYSAEAARLSHEAGKEVILHLPMEADNSHENPGAGAILTSMSDRAIVDTVDRDLASVPYAIGANNHMGSRATADTRVMRAVLGELKNRNLFFLDSRTTAKSVAKGIAKELHVPFAQREVFLDNQQSRQSIENSLHDAEQIAEKHGYAVMIGHVWTNTLAEFFTQLYPELLDKGFEFGKLSELIRENSGYGRTGN
jgi:hypothetical protein